MPLRSCHRRRRLLARMRLSASPSLLWAMAGLVLTALPGESTLQPRCDLYSLPGCPRNFNPVCGTDGETYANECMLCMSNKEYDKDIQIAYKTSCS